jgi:hypothetical protein
MARPRDDFVPLSATCLIFFFFLINKGYLNLRVAESGVKYGTGWQGFEGFGRIVFWCTMAI